MPLFTFRPSDTVHVVCYHCDTRQEVGRRALTVTCKACHKPLQIGDVHVKKYDARRKVQTTGSVIVEKKGQIVADRVECGGLVARGEIKAKDGIACRGPVLIGPAATVTGDLSAPTVAVGAGATLRGFYVVGKDDFTPTPLTFEEPTEGLAGTP